MTKIIYDPASLTLRACGHAGAKGTGEYDLVCCGISTLMFSLAAALDAFDIRYESAVDQATGYMSILAIPARHSMQQCRTIYGTITAGLELLAVKYPEYVHFDISEEVL